MNRKTVPGVGAALCILLVAVNPAFAQGTAFTYQGRLNNAGGPASGNYDLTFSLFDVSSGAGQVGGTLTNSATTVNNGLFVATLDFGGVFNGSNYWLEIAVRTNGNGAFSILSPRQKLTPAPYAITAGNLTGTLPASQLNGTLPSSVLAGAYAGALSLNNAANSFAGNGGGLTNVNAATLGGLSAAKYWQLGGNNVAPGQFIGSTNNQALELKANGVRALRLEGGAASGKAVSEGYLAPNGAPNMIGGSPLNFVAPNVAGATIGGGGATNYENISYSNSVLVDFGTIGGGVQNTIEGNDYGYTSAGSTIGGGTRNTIKTNAIGSAISGGAVNTIQTNALFSAIGGGAFNQVSGPGAFIGGGGSDGSDFEGNSAGGNLSTIGGGLGNTIGAGATGAFIGGGRENFNGSAYSTIAGGLNNTNQSSTGTSAIGGGWLNFIQDGADQSVIAGGNAGKILSGARESFVGGGFDNIIQTNAANSFIGGGAFNVIGTNSAYSTIAGGAGNSVQSNAPFATVAGGNANSSSANSATVSGGYLNTSVGYAATIGGGAFNSSSGGYSTVGGGGANTSLGAFSTVSGGNGNGAYALSATVGGGEYNTSSGSYSTVPGGSANTAGGLYSFAAGRSANALHNGAFVWADSTGPAFGSSANDQFLVRAANGVGINKTNPATALDVNGTVTATGFSGGFTGSGANLTALNASQLSIGTVPAAALSNAWRIGGNAGTVPGTQFIGTSDNQPLEFKVNNQRGLRLEPTGYPDTINVIGGSVLNSAGAAGATIGGGGSGNYGGVAYTNEVDADFGTVSGGRQNMILSFADSATIGGGYLNTIRDSANNATIGGGTQNTVESTANSATIGGGSQNTIYNFSHYATIGGGSLNSIQSAVSGTIGGGLFNTIQSSAVGSTIGGGNANTIQSSAQFATVPGGLANSATDYAFAAGRRAKANHLGAFVWADSTDADFASTANNQFLIRAAGGVGIGVTAPQQQLSVASGANIDQNSANSGTVASSLTFGSASGEGIGSKRTAGGNQFGLDFYTGSANRMSILNTGNVGINKNNPAATLDVNGTERVQGANNWNVTGGEGDFRVGNDSFRFKIGVANGGSGSGDVWMRAHGGTQRVFIKTPGGTTFFSNEGESTGVNLAAGGGAWSALSDRNSKENFVAVDTREILQRVASLPLTSWNYKSQEKSIRHIGPMAQDFASAFQVGEDEKHITTIDADGVALAAIQGLNEKVEGRSQQAEASIQELRAENEQLKARLEKLEQLLEPD